MDEKETEFDLLVQRTKQRIALENELESLFDCSKGHPKILKKYLSGRLVAGKLSDLRQNFPFFKKFR